MDQSSQMEWQTKSDCFSFISSKSVSWPILHGSLDDTVSCESSRSPVDPDATPKPALVLRRPSGDCGPCEIKISFEEKHEVRQVYVRSTARVYEIYYAADRQSMNEYLCTVRCGMAEINKECLAKEELPNNDAVTSISPSSNGSNKMLKEGLLKPDSGGSTNEDGWVEIKDPDPSLIEDGDSSHSNKTEVCVQTENQDFYEATAEISDGNPCTSITIRLLSLHTRESVYLDEVYVFAVPVECDDDNPTTEGVECSSGNSLMAMLVPTLLQLSKSRMSQVSERRDSSLDKADRDRFQSMSSVSTAAKIQQEEIPSVSNKREMETDKMECPDQLQSLEVPTQPSNKYDKSDTTTRMDACSNHIGKTLDQLVSRIARIEEFCLSFEKRMINPITSMDARLGNVEQQLKLLNEKFQVSEVHPSTGIYAANSSSSDIKSNSFYTDGNTIPNCKAESLEKDDGLSYEVQQAPSSDTPSARDASFVPIVVTAPEFSICSEQFENDDCLSDEVENPVSGISSVACARAHLVPSLIVTAPEFSCGDEEEENDVSKSVGESPRDELKKSMTIDDALAFALAGFLSSTSMEESTSALHPDAANVDYDNYNVGATVLTLEHLECNQLVVGADHITATVETLEEPVAENGKHEVLPFDRNSEPTVEIITRHAYVLRDESDNGFVGHDHDEPDADNKENDLFFGSSIEPSVEIIAGHDKCFGEESAHKFIFHDVDGQIVEAGKAVAETETRITEEVEIGNAEKDASKILSEVENKDSYSGEKVIKEASDVLNNILDLPINSAVDYRIPVLDVKFASQDASNISTSIEALFTETDVGSSSVQERGRDDIADQYYSVKPDNVEVTALESSDHLLVDFNPDCLRFLSHNNEGRSHDPCEPRCFCGSNVI